MAHLDIVASQVSALQAIENGTQPTFVDGHSLDVASIVAVSRKSYVPKIDDSDATKNRVAAAVDVVQSLAKEEQSQSGVTGFGGNETALQQKNFLASILCGILPDLKTDGGKTLTPEDYKLMMPQDWVRGTMLVRLNSVVRGHSGTRWNVVENLQKLIQENVAPCAPLRQSVAASGDLGPLAYISSVLTGNPDTYAWYGEGENRKVYDSPTVLSKLNMEPVSLIAKEGLALVNGTAASSAVAALAIHDCHVLASASQVFSAYAVETIKGSQESFQPFIHESARPHKGQVEVAANIRNILSSSKLARVQHENADPEGSLRQDSYCVRGSPQWIQRRQDSYSIRGSPQWIGPSLEDLVLAQDQISVELNSTTDNPVVDIDANYMHHGANFLAMSITSASEKMRLALHHIAKLTYTQLTELLNNNMNKGLPPNLSVNEPSLDYCMKASDVAAASYLSEIAYLASPVSTHVISAESHNQPINSLALTSARYTMDAVKLVRMIMSTHLFALVQATDLRAMEGTFRALLFETLRSETIARFGDISSIATDDDDFFQGITHALIVLLNATTSEDSHIRFDGIFRKLSGYLLKQLKPKLGANQEISLSAVEGWTESMSTRARDAFVHIRDTYVASADSKGYELLGRTKGLYKFVRGDLGVQLHYGDPQKDKVEIGTEVAKIFRSFENGSIGPVLLNVMGK
ncbi:aromatic amino acid lyase-domain-containing protein [Lentinula aciculospora]|uniref:Aromatic amino acid lyase-domain-containing protein n=1 Tax=Lentinula aciculospora TaxID=153920 RepID=A0A9W9ABY2_9AGAR|nr:aromatic amino acid lyase-domain-containing protein [Lentinula aciculospora]